MLATDDPYQAAAAFVQAGWSLVVETPRDSGDQLACVELGGAQVMLGIAAEEFLAPASRPHKGAGVTFHVTVPVGEIQAISEAHRAHAEAATELSMRPWGEEAFSAVLMGYRFGVRAVQKRQPCAAGRMQGRGDTRGCGGHGGGHAGSLLGGQRRCP